MTDFEKGLYFTEKQEYDKAILCFKKCARDGSSEAMNNLASIYVKLKDYEQAIATYKDLVKKGYRKAYKNLVILYEITKQYEKEAKILQEMVEFDETAVINLAYLKINFLNQEQEGLDILKKAAANQNALAYLELGNYFQHNGNLSEAKENYNEASRLGNTEAMFHIGKIYYETKNFKDAEFWLNEAAKGGHVSAYTLLGDLYYLEKKEYVKAFEKYEVAANNDDGYAMNKLGNLYQNIFHNASVALKWYKLAIEQKHIPAMVSLGYFYFKEPDFYDFNSARSWFTQAYKANELDGLVGLGYIYFYDENNKNATKALDYLSIAVKRGSVHAMILLGQIYSKDVINYDLEQAKTYYTQALNSDTSGMVRYKLANVYAAERNNGKFLALLNEACDREYPPALYQYGKLLCDNSFVRFDYLQGLNMISRASDLMLIEATKFLAVKYADKRCKYYDPSKASFYANRLITQIVDESQRFETPKLISNMSTDELISSVILLLDKIQL